MVRVTLSVSVCLAMSALVGWASVSRVRADEPKFTIKEVMAKAMKGGLLAKVAEAKASDDDRKTLVEMMEALAATPAPAGNAENWKTRVTALVEGAQGVVDKVPGANDKLRAAAHCTSCHSQHRP